MIPTDIHPPCDEIITLREKVAQMEEREKVRCISSLAIGARDPARIKPLLSS